MWLFIVLLVGGMYLLIKGSDIFVESSVKIAKFMGISELLIGMTLVCFGTSLPELFVSINGSLKGTSDLVIGNMVGSNIFNICVILGLVAIMHPLRLLNDTVRKDIYMSIATGLVFLFVSIDTFGTTLSDNMITRADGAILLVMFVIYMYYNLYNFGGITAATRRKIEKKKNLNKGEETVHKEKLTRKQKRDLIESIVLSALGAMLVYVGSECTLNGAVGLATSLGVSQTFIAILVVAIGTSLPELATSFSAMKKRRINVAIGNLIGSNMFNMLFVTGMAAVINPLSITTSSLIIDIILFILVMTSLLIFTKIKYLKKGHYELSKTDGIVLICVYIIYAIYVVFRG